MPLPPARSASSRGPFPADTIEEHAGDRRNRVLGPEGRGGAHHVDDQPEQCLGQPRGRDIAADVAELLATSDQLAHRSADPFVESRRVRSRALARENDEAVAHAHERADGALEAVGDGDLVEARGAKALAGVFEGDPLDRLEQRLAVGEVAVDGRTGDAGGGGDVAHARLLALTGERTGRRVDDGCGDSFAKGWAGSLL